MNNMIKPPDFGISRVSYSQNHVHIERVEIIPLRNPTLSYNSVVSREAVITSIERGGTFSTLVRGNTGYQMGELVRLLTTRNGKFIRTLPNDEEKDDLGNLPEL